MWDSRVCYLQMWDFSSSHLQMLDFTVHGSRCETLAVRLLRLWDYVRDVLDSTIKLLDSTIWGFRSSNVADVRLQSSQLQMWDFTVHSCGCEILAVRMLQLLDSVRDTAIRMETSNLCCNHTCRTFFCTSLNALCMYCSIIPDWCDPQLPARDSTKPHI